MKIIKAEHLGMCFGVRDAIALAIDTVRHEPLTILGDLFVHNETVLAGLREHGIRFAQDSGQVTTPHGNDHRARRLGTRHSTRPRAGV